MNDTRVLPMTGYTDELRFDVAEGTWISLDVTPDGGRVVFDLAGSLQEMPIAGGVATVLTDGIPYDSQPRVSPDGRWIAFLSDRDGADNLWALNREDASLRQLSHNRQSISISASWSPDGSRILVSETISYLSEASFRWYSLAGGPAEDLLDADSEPVRGAGGVLSPDSRFLYFSRRDPSDEQVHLMPIGQLHRLDLDSNRIEKLTQGPGGGVRPLLSPDGCLLVYGTRSEGRTGLRLRDLVSGADRQLVWPVEQDRQAYGRALRGDQLPGYAFTPDGKTVLTSYGGRIRRIDIADGTSHRVAFRATVIHHVGPRLHRPARVERGPVTARIAHEPSWSPDGRQVAVSMLNRIYVRAVDGHAGPRRLTRSSDTELGPVWSPDGRRIAYLVWSSSECGHIWSAPVDGSTGPQRLTATPAFYTDLCYSADGRLLLALRGLGDASGTLGELPDSLDLVRLPVAGGPIEVIAAAYRGRHPHFGEDPGRIFSTDGHALLSIGLDGSDEQTELRVLGRFDSQDNLQPTAERILRNPRGESALALINKQLWLIPYSKTSSTLPVVNVRADSGAARRLTRLGADYFGWAPDGLTIHWALGSTVCRSPLPGVGEVAIDSGPSTTRLRVVVEAPRAIPTGGIMLRGGRVITMVPGCDPEILEATDVVVERDRIVAIGPTGSVTVPDGARQVDVAGRFVVPGYIDTHAHWDYPAPELPETENWSLRANLAYGVTSGLDVQSNDVANFVYQDLIECGRAVGSRAFMVGPGIFGVNNYKPYEADFTSYDDALAYLLRYRDHYRVHLVKAYLSGNRRQRQWLVLACHELGLMATTEGFGDRVLHLTHAVDGMHGNEHAITDSDIYDDVVQTLVRTRTTHTSTLTITHYGLAGMELFLSRHDLRNDAKLCRFYPRETLSALTSRRAAWGHESEFSIVPMARQAAKLQRAGGLVGVGSHGEIQGLGFHFEMEMLSMGGMTPAEILIAATSTGARVIGFEDDLGSIEVGKLADLVILEADPLTDIRNARRIVLVMKDGVLYDGETLDFR